MTLFGAILKKVVSKDSVTKKYSSPPPEIEEIALPKIKKKVVLNKYAKTPSKVDSSSPRLDASRFTYTLPARGRHVRDIYYENAKLLMAIRNTHFTRGKVDCHWRIEPPSCNEHYVRRLHFLRRVQRENKYLYARLKKALPRVVPTADLHRDWSRNRQEILTIAQNKFVLFPPVPTECIEDTAFIAPAGAKRTRVRMTLRLRDGATLGHLTLELFSDVCPATCRLFLELLHGDGLGHGYVGTKFYRKVPELYWSGGDVIYDNGFGCYAQRGRRQPIAAENYHFSHSMPGLLSMRVTADDEVCGLFNITFKPLSQFDLRNVVFGRVVRPCRTFESIRCIGSALSSQPTVQVAAAKVWRGRWVLATPHNIDQ